MVKRIEENADYSYDTKKAKNVAMCLGFNVKLNNYYYYNSLQTMKTLTRTKMQIMMETEQHVYY